MHPTCTPGNACNNHRWARLKLGTQKLVLVSDEGDSNTTLVIHHLLPLRVSISRKLELESGPGLLTQALSYHICLS